jgi:hypothetical protein
MVLNWCTVLARAIRSHLHTEAQPERPRDWRGEPLAAVGTPTPGKDPYQTLLIVRVSNCPPNSPTTRSPPISPAPDALGPGGRPWSFSESHS